MMRKIAVVAIRTHYTPAPHYAFTSTSNLNYYIESLICTFVFKDKNHVDILQNEHCQRGEYVPVARHRRHIRAGALHRQVQGQQLRSVKICNKITDLQYSFLDTNFSNYRVTCVNRGAHLNHFNIFKYAPISKIVSHICLTDLCKQHCRRKLFII